MATNPTVPSESEPESGAEWERVSPEWDEERTARNKAIREELLKAGSVRTVHREWTVEEARALFKRLHDHFQARFPGRDPLAEFMAERRAGAERE